MSFLGKPLYRRVWKTNILLPKTTDNPSSVTFSSGYFPVNGYVTRFDAVIDDPSNNNIKVTNNSSPFTSALWTNFGDGNMTFYRKEDVTGADMYIKAIIAEYTKEKWS